MRHEGAKIRRRRPVFPPACQAHALTANHPRLSGACITSRPVVNSAAAAAAMCTHRRPCSSSASALEPVALVKLRITLPSLRARLMLSSVSSMAPAVKEPSSRSSMRCWSSRCASRQSESSRWSTLKFLNRQAQLHLRNRAPREGGAVISG